MALVYEPKIMRIVDGESGYATLRCSEAVYKHNLEGVDELTVTTTDMLGYTDRVLFCDRMGRWHEMMYDSGRHGHESGAAPSGSVKLYSSVNELWDAYVLDKRPDGSADTALTSILTGTRWQVGSTFDVDGSHGFVFYHKTARECLKEICEAFNCFFRPTITVEGGRITERRIDLFRSLGETPKRFTWTKDLTSVYRELGDEKPKTRVYGWGKGVETEAGGYGRRLSFADINGGKAYVEDTTATEALGYVGADGHRMPLEGDYVNEQCDDPEQLLAETRAYLAGVSQPSVRYTADVISLADFGRDWENVEVGQTAAIIDKGFSDEGLRLRGQVAELSEDLINKRTVVGFGTITDILSARQAVVSQSLSSLRDQSAGWQVTTDAGVSWLNTVMGNLNAAFDQSGTYKFSSFTQGDIWSSVPLDENGRATKPGGWAINLNGAGMRLASSLKPDGSWDWRAFGTGKGFSADFMNAGTLDASRVTIKNLMRIGREDGWHLALAGDSVTMTDEDDATALKIQGVVSSIWGSQTSYPSYNRTYTSLCPQNYNNGMRYVKVTLGCLNESGGTFTETYTIVQPMSEKTAVITHLGHVSIQNTVQVKLIFDDSNDKMTYKISIRNIDLVDVSPSTEPLTFIAFRFYRLEPSAKLVLAGGNDEVLTKQNFAEQMGTNNVAPYTGTFTLTFDYKNTLLYRDLVYKDGLLISVASRSM
jgi:phage minor structural protein